LHDRPAIDRMRDGGILVHMHGIDFEFPLQDARWNKSGGAEGYAEKARDQSFVSQLNMRRKLNFAGPAFKERDSCGGTLPMKTPLGVGRS
jgi:hypothetical protein